MKVYEARALTRRVADDMDTARIAVQDAVQIFRGLVASHTQSEQNPVYAGEAAGNVALAVEQHLDEAYRRVGILQRSLEVAVSELREARKDAR